MTDKIYNIIYNNLDPWTEQKPDFSKEELFESFMNNIKSGLLYAVENKGLVFILQKESVYCLRLHVMSECKSYNILRAGVELTHHIFENTMANKIYGVTANKKFIAFANRAGWSKHGTLTESFMTKNGSYIDQHILGVTKQEAKNSYERLING